MHFDSDYLPCPEAPHGRRLRLGRHSRSDQDYLITACTQARMPLFRDVASGRIVVSVLREIEALGLAHTLAFVVMPDHLHWLLTLHAHSLGRVINRAKSRSALLINRRQGGTGPVWQRGYHDRALRAEEERIACARYIVSNPLRAGLVDKIGDYPLWDSAWMG